MRDEYEENDIPYTAAELTVVAEDTMNFDDDNIDWVKFRVEAGKTYTMETKHLL